MEIGIIREGSNERTKDRRARRKASKAKRAAAAAAEVSQTDLVAREAYSLRPASGCAG